MKRKLKYISSFIAAILVICFSSCLKKDLIDYPLYDTNEISLVNVEYRYNGTKMMNGQPIVAVQKLNVTQTINNNTHTIDITIVVPPASANFPETERAKVSQNKLWFYVNISTAATIAAVDGTPKLGDPTDATKPLKYVVTAANGASKTWTINVTSFTP